MRLEEKLRFTKRGFEEIHALARYVADAPTEKGNVFAGTSDALTS
jgi:hypothetical protein